MGEAEPTNNPVGLHLVLAVLGNSAVCTPFRKWDPRLVIKSWTIPPSCSTLPHSSSLLPIFRYTCLQVRYSHKKLHGHGGHAGHEGGSHQSKNKNPQHSDIRTTPTKLFTRLRTKFDCSSGIRPRPSPQRVAFCSPFPPRPGPTRHRAPSALCQAPLGSRQTA